MPSPTEANKAEIPGLAMPVLGDGQASREIYAEHLKILRDIVTVDHFGNEMGPSIADARIKGLHPGAPLPTHIKGFYQGSLRASMSIELARGSLKFIMHETSDQEKITTYAKRMLIALSTLDDLHELGDADGFVAQGARTRAASRGCGAIENYTAALRRTSPEVATSGQQNCRRWQGSNSVYKTWQRTSKTSQRWHG